MTHSRFMADISSNNLHYDADAYKAGGGVLIGIKATEGTGFINPNHRGWCLRSGLHHIGVVHYHFARPDLSDSPESEADHFLATALPLAGGRDYLVCDMERNVPSGFKRDPGWTRAFDTRLQERSRFHTVLYIDTSLLESGEDWLVGDLKRLWEANFSKQPSFVPRGYSLFARQFTDGLVGPEPHSMPGVGQCDISRLSLPVFNRALTELP